MKLNSKQANTEFLLDSGKWSTAVFLGIFIVSTSLILFYFNLLYCIQKELEDPSTRRLWNRRFFSHAYARRFGRDFSDLRLRRGFLTPLIKDFRIYAKAGEGGESTSTNKDAKLLELNSGNLGESADDDGEADKTADRESEATVKN